MTENTPQQSHGGTVSVSGGTSYGAAVGLNTGTINNSYNINQAIVRSGSAPPLPTMIVGRADDLRELKARLGIGMARAAMPVQVLTAVRGWPGVGKTTIAAAIAHDPEVLSAFPDGILWTSLGQAPNLLSELAAWGRALGADDLLRSTVEDALARLTALLRNKRVLLIVDDVWEPEHRSPSKLVDVGAPCC